MMRWLRGAAAALTLVVVVVALAFPTDAVVRWAIVRLTPPGAPFVVFRRAVLRPWGLRLDDVAVRRPDGTALVGADWFRLRPSLWGLVRDRTGRPWRLATAICRGRIDATVAADGPANRVDLSWQDIDLGDCPPLATNDVALAGHTDGDARIRLASGTPPSGAGEVRFRDASWSLPRPLIDLHVLHAEAASVRWDLQDSRLVLDAVDLRGPELEVTGRATFRLAGSLGRSGLDLRLLVLAGPEAPGGLRLLIDGLPLAHADPPLARRLVVTGTVDEPQVTR
jgi:type II secretion system protein N